jgi:hypothetical protein
MNVLIKPSKPKPPKISGVVGLFALLSVGVSLATHPARATIPVSPLKPPRVYSVFLNKKNNLIKQQAQSRTGSVPAFGAGPMGLMGLFLGSMTGCAGLKSAGDTCYGIDYVPGGRGYPDSDFEQIRDLCRLDLTNSWSITGDGPAYSEACEQAILDLLPLDTSLRTATAAPGPGIRANLARAFHTLLFYPVADEGQIFGSDSESDYCDSVYQDFLGTDRYAGGGAARTVLTEAGYDSGYSQMNLHLVRFILERIDTLRSVSLSDAPGVVARAKGRALEFTSLFKDINGAINLAAILVHEARHVSEGFPDGSAHVECTSAEEAGQEACDDFMFGSYGAQFSYIDSALRGSLQTTLEDGTPLLSGIEIQSLVSSACSLYQLRVNVPEGDLAEIFGRNCSDLTADSASGIEAFVRDAYGLEYEDLSLR